MTPQLGSLALARTVTPARPLKFLAASRTDQEKGNNNMIGRNMVYPQRVSIGHSVMRIVGYCEQLWQAAVRRLID